MHSHAEHEEREWGSGGMFEYLNFGRVGWVGPRVREDDRGFGVFGCVGLTSARSEG